MKLPNHLYLLLIFSIMLSGCVSSELTAEPIRTQTQSASPTSIPPTTTPILQPTPTETLTPLATLAPEQAKVAIGTLLREPVDCIAPCFWGIIPGQTTLVDAEELLGHLGLQLKHTNRQNNKDFYSFIYDLDSGLRVSPIFTIEGDIVKSVTVDITSETQKPGVPREWLAYSPETLIHRYGSPSRVDFFVGRGAPAISYAMVMYFDTMNTIIEYGSHDVTLENSSFRVCPLEDQYDGLRIWLGARPEHPPLKGVPLEEATSMTMEEFSNLLTGNPNNACIKLKAEMFP